MHHDHGQISTDKLFYILHLDHWPESLHFTCTATPLVYQESYHASMIKVCIQIWSVLEPSNINCLTTSTID